MSMMFEKKNEAIWTASTHRGKYLCFCTGDMWAVFFNDSAIATKVKTVYDAHDIAVKHKIMADDIDRDFMADSSIHQEPK